MILKYGFVGLMLIAGVNATAQNTLNATQQSVSTQTPGEEAAALTAEMTTALSLTPAQVEQVTVLNLKVANKIEAINTNASFTTEKKNLFSAGNKADHKNIMVSILTAQQLTTYEAMLLAGDFPSVNGN